MSLNERQPSWLSRLFRRALVGIYKGAGWHAHGVVPEPRKFVLIAAPHTSNWDFVYFLGLTDDLGIKPHFMAKTSLFRSSNRNYVQQMIDEFRRRDEFMLTIAPEGTRGTVKAWKTGFYHIAMGAGVPLVVGMMDYGSKTGGLGPAIWPTGDYKADMAKVAEIYAKVKPKYPAKGMTEIFARDDA